MPRFVNLPGIAAIVAAICLWQLAASVGPASDLESFPSPAEVASGLGEMVTEGSLFGALQHTIVVTVIASAIGISAGALIGVLLGLVPPIRLFAGSTFDVLRTIPMVALMPVALLLWGVGAKTEIIVASVATTWPMLVNATGGITGVHPRLREVGRVFQFSSAKTVRRLILPAAAPQLLVGARLAVVTALIAAIVAEMLVSPNGLGWALVSEQNSLQYARMWGIVVVCGIVGYLLNLLLVTAMHRFDETQRS
ncbi:ABC transporter permease [Rhodococcus olei]|uniref:ABC transporter permease n=1 Tax=Rhodococcus olei TaxID=2161675 RepID=A0ABP8NWG0_9NOCA